MNVDLAIVGSGFAGSLMAMIARRLGRSVVLLERGQHPRFAIGESSTPLANLLLEELARCYDLPRLLPLSKWGAWQKAHPEIGCGLKRGFTFYHHSLDQPFARDSLRRNELLVAASPHDDIADTHWYRPDFDHFLVREAQSAGVEYLDEVVLKNVSEQTDAMMLSGECRGEPLTVRARLVVDATGPRGFLHQTLALAEATFENFPATQALFTHFTGVGRMQDILLGGPSSTRPTQSGVNSGRKDGDSWNSSFRSSGLQPAVPASQPPYPPDSAALHHVFEGGWIWVLHFNNGITSAGMAATDALAEELKLQEGGPAWHRLLARLPTVRAQFAKANATLPFVHQPRLSFRSGAVAGGRWALLPSAAGVVDPLLSTGFPLTLLGVTRLAAAISEDWDSPRLGARLAAYGEQTLQELDATGRLVGALYANLRDFDLFAALTRLYFAAASFSESARRLNRPELAASFLLCDDVHFGPALRLICERARQPLPPSARLELIDAIERAISPIDVAGLGRRECNNWFPARADDLRAAAHKLGASPAEIEEVLVRSGFVR